MVTDATIEVLDNTVLTTREMGEALRPDLPDRLAVWFDAETYPSFSALVSRGVALKGVLVMAARAGSSASFVRADQCLGDRPRELGHDEASAELVRRYLHAYAPSTADPFAEWGGIATEQAHRAFALVEDDTRVVHVADHLVAPDQDRLVLSAGVDRLIGDGDDPGATFVPAYVPYLSGSTARSSVPTPTSTAASGARRTTPGSCLSTASWSAPGRGARSSRLEVPVDPSQTPLGDDLADVLTPQAGRVVALRGCTQGDINIGGRPVGRPTPRRHDSRFRSRAS